MSTTKRCTSCVTVKTIIKFYSYQKKNRIKPTITSTCKDCHLKTCTKNRVKKKAHIGRIYSMQKRSSKKRNHPQPSYSLEELTLFMYDNKYKKLHKAWKKSNYNKNLTPSVDRLNALKPYTMENIQLITWKENNEKGRGEGKTKRVCQYLAGKPVNEFDSATKAAIHIKGSHQNISLCCRGGTPQAYGYQWEFIKPLVAKLKQVNV